MNYQEFVNQPLHTLEETLQLASLVADKKEQLNNKDFEKWLFQHTKEINLKTKEFRKALHEEWMKEALKTTDSDYSKTYHIPQVKNILKRFQHG